MQKRLLLIPLLIVAGLACTKSKPVEIEMLLPTPVPTPTLAITALPTAPLPTPTIEIPSPKYSIEDIKGTVLIIPIGASLPETADEGESVEPGDEILTKDDSETTLTLNADTMVHLSANTQIKVSSLSANTTNGFKSRIHLLIGNILSEVEKLGESRSSFEIEAGGVVCGVRGTAFEVEKQGVNISTSTYHGAVEMKKNGHVQKVNANEHSTFSLKRSSFLPKRHLNTTEKKNYQVWVKKKAVIQQKRETRVAGGVVHHTKPATKAVVKDHQGKGNRTGRNGSRNRPVPRSKAHAQAHSVVKAKSKKPAIKTKPVKINKPAQVRTAPRVSAKQQKKQQPQKQHKPQPKKAQQKKNDLN